MYHLQLTIHKKQKKKNARPLTLYPELNMKIVIKFQTFFVHKYIFLSNYILGLSFNYFDHNDVKCFVWGTQHVWNFHKKTYMYWFDNFLDISSSPSKLQVQIELNHTLTFKINPGSWIYEEPDRFKPKQGKVPLQYMKNSQYNEFHFLQSTYFKWDANDIRVNFRSYFQYSYV